MADGYIDTEDIVAYGFQSDLDSNSDLFDLLIPRASQLFDILCGVEPGHFLVKGTSATDRIVYGSGGVMLALPPHIGEVVSVTAPSPFLVPKYVEQEGYLKVTDWLDRAQEVTVPYPETGSAFGFLHSVLVWQRGVPFTVTATWGYAEVPETVKQATVELAITMWRSRDEAWTKAVNLDSNQVTFNPAIPRRAKKIAAAFRNARSSTSAFV